MNGTKPWYLSKTMIVNSLTTAIALSMALVGQEWIAEHPGATSALGAVIGILNVLLRTVTNKPVTL